MKAILELDLNRSEQKLVFDFLESMKIAFRSSIIKEKEVAFEEGASANEIKESVEACFGIWKNREDITNFNDFRKQAWVVGRGVK